VNGDAAASMTLAGEQRDVARARILRAARTALAARGLAATVDDVAAEAGVSRRTVFRHFATRDALFAAAIRAGVSRYGEQLPAAPPRGGDWRAWLAEVLAVTHRLNSRNGRVFWELTGIQAQELPTDVATAAEESRQQRNRFAGRVTRELWGANGGEAEPPGWLVDAVAVHLSGFTTQALGGDLGRSPEQVAEVSARVIEAALASALSH
jgi:AcrR family transcriptional regulator